jgi:hypothetical protein
VALSPFSAFSPAPDPPERHRRVPDVLLEPLHGVEIAFLDHIRGSTRPPEPAVEAYRHHPSQPAALVLRLLHYGGLVARGGVRNQTGDLSGWW